MARPDIRVIQNAEHLIQARKLFNDCLSVRVLVIEHISQRRTALYEVIQHFTEQRSG
jgi:hypothetical protein